MSRSAELLVDLGNTHLKWCLRSDAGCGSMCTAPYQSAGLPAILDQLWRALEPPRRVWAANVAGSATGAALAAWLYANWSQQVGFVATRKQAHGVTVGYSRPERFGVDRWLGLVAARGRCRGPLCVVDAGTAITLDAMDAAGQHLGGLILPGLTMMRTSLLRGTKIQTAEMADDSFPLLARDTADAIASGPVHACAALVERVCAALSAAPAGEPEIILTGGDGPGLARVLDRPALLVPDLVLEGLAIVTRQGADE